MAGICYLNGRLRNFAAIILQTAVIFASVVASATEKPVELITGVDVSRLIIERLAAEGLEGSPSVKSDRIFPACESTLKIQPKFGSWSTVAVSCVSGSGWRFMIRTNLNSRIVPVPIREFQRLGADTANGRKSVIERAVMARPSLPKTAHDEYQVVALARSVSRNDMIRPSDLVMVAVSERNAMGAFFNPADVIGRRMKMGLGVNKPVMSHHLYPAFLVEDGDEVLISASTGSININMLGFAQQNGQLGEWIVVKNITSGKTILGKIVDEKKVQVIAKK